MTTTTMLRLPTAAAKAEAAAGDTKDAGTDDGDAPSKDGGGNHPAAKSEPAAGHDDKTSAYECQVCGRRVGGGQAGHYQHVRSAFHLTWQLWNSGNFKTWQQAIGPSFPVSVAERSKSGLPVPCRRSVAHGCPPSSCSVSDLIRSNVWRSNRTWCGGASAWTTS